MNGLSRLQSCRLHPHRKDLSMRWSSSSRPRQTILRLEALEERAVPTILFSSAGSRNVRDLGGPVITHVQLDLIFWGAGWNTGVGPNLKNQLTTSVGEMMNSPYLSGLSQYRGVGNGSLLQTDLITTTNPATNFTDAQVSSFVATNINNQTLPPATTSQIFYMVIPQPGSTGPGGGIGGEHGSGAAGGVRYHYGWSITSSSNADSINLIVSHELTEGITDSEVNFRTAFVVTPTNDEISDGEAQNYFYRLNGAVVQSSLSQADRAYDIYDGNSQKFLVSNNTTRILTVNGDQLASHDDTITVDLVGNNGAKVILNGETVVFDAYVLRGITINTGDGNDTVNILRTASSIPVTINSSGTATINIGNAGSLQGIAGAITITNPNGGDTISIDDSADTTARNVRVDTVTQTGTTYTRVSGLSTGAISYGINDAAGVTVQTGTRGSTVTLVAVNAPLTLSGSAGALGFNTLIGSGPDNAWSLSGQDAGVLTGSAYAAGVSFSGFQNLTGGPGATDTFAFADGAGVSGNLTAGGGGGTLDYTNYSTSVVVDLQTGSATGVGGAVANIGTVLGGTGNGSAGAYNLLIGAGGNLLQGGTGRRNILVAGSSASTLVAGDNEDLLIGGSTNYDQEAGLVTWLQIANYWAGSDDRGTRTANLLSGSGVPLLDATVVTGNGGSNVFTGNGAWALLYTDGADSISGFDPAANQVTITP
jgi:hypothetical protein